MIVMMKRLIAAAIACMFAGSAAADTIRLAIQKTGTVAWELAVIRAHRLDEQAGLDLAILELARPEGGKIGLRGGSAGYIGVGWVLGARGGPPGRKRAFYPYFSAGGAR